METMFLQPSLSAAIDAGDSPHVAAVRWRVGGLGGLAEEALSRSGGDAPEASGAAFGEFLDQKNAAAAFRARGWTAPPEPLVREFFVRSGTDLPYGGENIGSYGFVISTSFVRRGENGGLYLKGSRALVPPVPVSFVPTLSDPRSIQRLTRALDAAVEAVLRGIAAGKSGGWRRGRVPETAGAGLSVRLPLSLALSRGADRASGERRKGQDYDGQ